MSHPIPESISLDDLKVGFSPTETELQCLFCEESFTRGHIYQRGDDLIAAELAMHHHVRSKHGSAFEGLLKLGKKDTGLSDTQQALLDHFHSGLTDKEIQPLMGGVSLSTIRNHRFQLRTKARQARVFLAIMELLEEQDRDPGSRFIPIPGRKSADDERFAITVTEFKKIIKGQFPDGPDGMMIRFPKKEKRKVAVMIHVLNRFEAGKRYSQTQVNGVLATASEDYTTLCRFMVDYGFLGRTRDGREYWVE